MIAKSNQISGAKKLADHLSSTENESVSIIQIKGLISQESIHEVLAEMDAIAKASCCKKHLYHVSISPSPDESITDKQWNRIWQLYDQIHNLHDLCFIEVQHNKKKRKHRHRVYERVNTDTGLAVNLSWTRIKNERFCRQIEVEFGHKIIFGNHTKSAIKALKKDGHHEIANKLKHLSTASPKIATHTHREWQQDKNTNSLSNIRQLLAMSWNSKQQRPFKDILQEHGFKLKDGKKALLVTDENGKEYPILRNINVGLKSLGVPSIRKKELMHRLNQTYLTALPLPLVMPEKLNKNKKKKKIPEGNKTPHKNTIQPGKYIRHDWVIYRENLLDRLYKDLETTNLAKFWKVQQLDDGIIKLTNKLGDIYDHGDTISTNSENHNIAANTMVKLAIAKKWDNIKANGSDEFKLASYKEAISNNIKCTFESQDDYHIWLQAERILKKNTGLRLS